MIYIGALFHAYQPAWQFPHIMKKIVEECYRPLFEFLSSCKSGYTINVNYSLLEQLKLLGYADILEMIRKAAESGYIELTGSGAFHPILPLIPAKEVERQIALNKDGIRKILDLYPGTGLFPPEMAFSESLILMLKKHGINWTITEDVPFCETYGYAPYDFIPSVKGVGVFLRSCTWSKKIAMEKIDGYRKATPREIVEWMHNDLGKWFDGKDGYLVIAMDMETLGHHIREYRSFLQEFMQAINSFSDMRLATLSEIFEEFPKKEMYVPDGSWSTSAEDHRWKNPYPLWNSQGNEAHRLLWELVNLALKVFKKGNKQSRDKMDRTLNSCQFWWMCPGGHYNPGLGIITTEKMTIDLIKKDGSKEDFWLAKRIYSELKRILGL